MIIAVIRGAHGPAARWWPRSLVCLASNHNELRKTFQASTNLAARLVLAAQKAVAPLCLGGGPHRRRFRNPPGEVPTISQHGPCASVVRQRLCVTPGAGHETRGCTPQRGATRRCRDSAPRRPPPCWRRRRAPRCKSAPPPRSPPVHRSRAKPRPRRVAHRDAERAPRPDPHTVARAYRRLPCRPLLMS